MPQVNYITDNNGVLMVDKIIKLEELNNSLPVILDEMGFKTNVVSHVNQSKRDQKGSALTNRLKMLREGIFQSSLRVNTEIIWTESAISSANRMYKSDFDNFGYDENVNDLY